jgi:hypothetical protein
MGAYRTALRTIFPLQVPPGSAELLALRLYQLQSTPLKRSALPLQGPSVPDESGT